PTTGRLDVRNPLSMRIALTYQHVDPTRGGAETYVVDLATRLLHAGHRVDLFAHEWRDGCLPTEVTTHRVPISGVTRWGRIWSFAANSERALRAAESEIDCTVGFINTWHQDVLMPQGGVHAASLEANSKRFPPGWRRGLYTLGKRANPKRWIYRAIEAKQYDPARGTRIVAVSRMVRGHLERYQGVSRERIDVIPNAIDAGRLGVADPSRARAEFRAKFGLGPDDLVALFVGHNYALKGLAPLIRALAARKHSGRPIHLVACGASDTGSYQALAERLGLTNTVHLAGFQPDIRPPFWASDFFVLPTYYDPCSLVVFEALACGLPVITTACNGAGEVITEGREGFVVPHPDATEALAGALDRMTDDVGRAAMSAQAARLGREQSFDRHVTRLLDVFVRVAESKGRAGSRSAA
ncbi:MAG TPA: glycosyltransferase family 4 protein, partial [Isosphaeraceae bacterium]